MRYRYIHPAPLQQSCCPDNHQPRDDERRPSPHRSCKPCVSRRCWRHWAQLSWLVALPVTLSDPIGRWVCGAAAPGPGGSPPHGAYSAHAPSARTRYGLFYRVASGRPRPNANKALALPAEGLLRPAAVVGICAVRGYNGWPRL